MKKMFFLFLLLATSVQAKDIASNSAILRSMDKITGRVQKVNVVIGEPLKVGTLSVVVDKCFKKPPEETPENAAFLTITDEDTPQKPVFQGWMFSSNPALSAMEHPVYDIWVVGCGNEYKKEAVTSEETKPIEPESESDELIED